MPVLFLAVKIYCQNFLKLLAFLLGKARRQAYAT